MVEYKKSGAKTGGKAVQGKSTVTDEATIHLEIENVYKDEMAFDGDIQRILSTFRNHLGNPVGIVHDGCSYYIDTGFFGCPIEDLDDWYNGFMSEQADEVIRRMKSKGFPEDCADEYAHDFIESFYNVRVSSGYGVDSSEKEIVHERHGVNSRLSLQFRLGTSLTNSEVQRHLNTEVNIYTRLGSLHRVVYGGVNGIFNDFTKKATGGSGVTDFWIHRSGDLHVEWLAEMAHVGLEKKFDLNDLTLRAWPHKGWGDGLSHAIGGHLPDDFDWK